MKPRHRASIRLTRSSAGERAGAARPLAVRLEKRSHALDREFVLPIPQRALVYERHAKPLAKFKLADPSPNAPLLKRVVRHPYALEPEGARRINLINPPTKKRDRGSPQREAVQVIFAASRDARNRPAAAAPTLPERRPLPFVRHRDAAEEVHWEHVHGDRA